MNTDFPYAQNPSQAVPEILPYDLVIEEEYPGIVFIPTIPGATYAEIRVVNGCLWFVVNAGWNPNTLQWEQDSPCNPALPAYALVQCDDSGTLTWNIAQPTGAIDTAVVWVPVWKLASDGTMTVEPLTLTAESEVAETVDVTWNAGTAADMIARMIAVTDTSSAAGSALDQLSVNGTIVWEVRKDGTLVIGKVPTSAIVGSFISAVGGEPGIVNVSTAATIATVTLAHGDYVDTTNTQTIAAAKTFATVPVFFGSASGSEGSIEATSESIVMPYGSKYAAAPFTFEAEATTAAIIEVKDDGTFNFYSDSGLTPSDTYNPTLRLSVSQTGNFASGGNVPANVLADEFEGTDGVTVGYDPTTQLVNVSGAGLLATVTSTGGTIEVTFPEAQTVNLEVAPQPVAAGEVRVNAVTSGPVSLTAPGANTLRYTVTGLASALTGSSQTLEITGTGSSTDAGSSGFNGGSSSASSGGEGGQVSSYHIGTCAGGDTVTVTPGGSASTVIFVQIQLIGQ